MTIKPYLWSDGSVSARDLNVADYYKKWTLDEVRADLDSKRSDVVNIFMNLTSDFNKASGIRANNAFCGKEVYIVGRRKFNRVGAVGTYQYEHVYSADTLEEVIEKLHEDNYTVYAVDNILEYNPKNIWDVKFPKKSAFVYGEEMLGLSEESIKMCDDMVYINQTGAVRSLNVACSSAVILSEYSRQHRL